MHNYYTTGDYYLFNKLTKRYNFNDYFFDLDNFNKLNVDYLNFLTGYYHNSRFHDYVDSRRRNDEHKFYKHFSDEFIDSYNTTLCYEHNDDSYVESYWNKYIRDFSTTRIIEFR